MFVYLFAIFLQPFGIFLWPFGTLVVIWYIFPRFGKLCQEKSGNPVLVAFFSCDQVTQFLSAECNSMKREKSSKRYHLIAAKNIILGPVKYFQGKKLRKNWRF
jgi:hypothetical protein